MLISKKNKIAIYEYLFKEGVLVAKKDFHAPRHPDIEVPNLQVIKAMQSLLSRGYVTEQYCWRHFYWMLNNEGIAYIRDFLHLPAEIVPATLKKRAFTEAARARPRGAMEGGARGPAPDREYRRAEGPSGSFGGDKKADVGAGASESFQFRGGFGRGRPGGGFGTPRGQDQPE
ncbi:ribosomal 40S subunit protein S10A [Nucella lapillus]